MTLAPDYLEFSVSEVEPVVAVMDRMTAAHEGWLNFEPAIEADAVPDEPGFFALFSGKGPSVPLATWTPPSAPGARRVEPAMVGLQHGAGSRARQVLVGSGHNYPEGWRVTQDHARKGLVVAVPPSASSGEVLGWLLRAAAVMSSVPLTGRWRAAIYGG